jgi:hypothetical protein
MHKTVYELIADTVADYTYPVCFDLPVGIPIVTFPCCAVNHHTLRR